MLRKVEMYMLDFHETPTMQDIKEAIEIAKVQNVIVNLTWESKWSGTFQRFIYADDDPAEVFKNRIPHVYGL